MRGCCLWCCFAWLLLFRVHTHALFGWWFMTQVECLGWTGHPLVSSLLLLAHCMDNYVNGFRCKRSCVLEHTSLTDPCLTCSCTGLMSEAALLLLCSDADYCWLLLHCVFTAVLVLTILAKNEYSGLSAAGQRPHSGWWLTGLIRTDVVFMGYHCHGCHHGRCPKTSTSLLEIVYGNCVTRG